MQWQQATFQIQTDLSVSAATLIVDEEDRRIMKSISPGIFSHASAFNTIGEIPVAIELTTAQEVVRVDNIATLTVLEGAPTIETIKAFTQDIETDTLNVSWTVNGTPTSFDIRYGTDQNNLSMQAQTTAREIILTDIVAGETYYIQIQALDAIGENLWPSKIHTFEPTILNAGGSPNTAQVANTPSCTVQGINLWVEETATDIYYIKWEAIENASSYTIYKSTFPATSISQMQRITSVQTTQYQYPFNAQAMQEEYAYYAVVANCNDGSEIQVDTIQHVQVGPVENILMVLLGAGVLYYIRRLYTHI